MLLVCEDYYSDWHEDLYDALQRNLLVAHTGRRDLNAALQAWQTQHARPAPRVLICTLTLVGGEAFDRVLLTSQRHAVTMMLVDECSQAAEGSLVPALLSLPDLLHLGALGDPYQLPPYGGGGGKQNGPPRSVFDLVAGGCAPRLLEEQYRMPPCICAFVSAEFYARRLRSAPARAAQADRARPLLWVDVPAGGGSAGGRGGGQPAAGGSTSLVNRAEAEAVASFCHEYAAAARAGAGGGNCNSLVVVLTLYEGQRQLIGDLVRASGLGEAQVQVHNVDSFQGQEADTVLVSLVVADRVSAFAADPRRACVLLSRARRVLRVFGNLKGLLRNPRAEVWGRLAAHCQERHWVATLTDLQLGGARGIRRRPSPHPRRLFLHGTDARSP